jgi:hypothetical protein
MISKRILAGALSVGILASLFAFTVLDRRGSSVDLELLRSQFLGYGAHALLEAHYYTDLATMTRESDVVVVGRVVSVESGGGRGPDHIRMYRAHVTVQVDEVLFDGADAGITEGATVVVSIPTGRVSDVTPARQAFEGLQAVWFLFDQELESLRINYSSEDAALNRGLYMLVSSQGLVANDRGVAVNVAAHPDEVTDLVRDTNGRSFAATVSRIRALGR